MNLLALDTSTPRSALAIERHDGERFAILGDASRRHGRELLPMIRDLLSRAELRATDLAAIGVGVGPGSYTGLRVGVTLAKTLAYATGAVLIGFDSLEFYGRSAPRMPGRIMVLSDAQRGDFHMAEFVRAGEDEALERMSATSVRSRAEVAERLDAPVTVVGPGLSRWDPPWPTGATPLADIEPDPRLLLDMLRESLAAGRSDDPWTLEPVYLRRSAAEDQWERRPS